MFGPGSRDNGGGQDRASALSVPDRAAQGLSLFFNPNGRIERGPFWIGFAAVTVLGTILGAARTFVVPEGQGLALAALQFALLYPLICVYGKRLHDAGRTAWWTFAALGVQLAAVGVFYVLLVGPILADVQTAAPDPDAYHPLRQEVGRRLFAPLKLGELMVAAATAYVVSILKSDPDANRFGPPSSLGEERVE